VAAVKSFIIYGHAVPFCSGSGKKVVEGKREKEEEKFF
jgi:hypothetical protein